MTDAPGLHEAGQGHAGAYLHRFPGPLVPDHEGHDCNFLAENTLLVSDYGPVLLPGSFVMGHAWNDQQLIVWLQLKTLTHMKHGGGVEDETAVVTAAFYLKGIRVEHDV